MAINWHDDLQYFHNRKIGERTIKYVVDPRLLQSEEKADEYIVKLLLKEGGFEAAEGSGISKMPAWLAKAFKSGSSRCAIIRNFLKFESDASEKIAPSETIFYSLLEGENAACRMVIEYVAKIKAKTNQRFNNERNLALLSRDPLMKRYYDECRDELTAMKSRKIGNMPITFLSVLTEPVEVLARYAGNEDFVNEFQAGDYVTAYPIYKAQLMRNFKAAIVRKKMTEPICESRNWMNRT